MDSRSRPHPALDARASAHPLASFARSIRLTGADQRGSRREFRCLSSWSASPRTALSEWLAAGPDGARTRLPVSHDIVVDDPETLVTSLFDAAKSITP